MRNKYPSHLLALIVLTLFITPLTHALPVGVGSQVWSDEFNGNALDSTKWAQLYPDGKWGDAFNSAAAITQSNGTLNLKAYTDSRGRQHSAVLATSGLYMAKYGYFESRMKFNDAPGEWSAFWLQSPNNTGTIVGNTSVAGTELDVAEHRAVDSTGSDIAGKINSALHWDGYANDAKFAENLTPSLTGVGNNGTWHTYGMRWSPTSYTFYVDDQPTWTSNAALSDADEFLMLSTLVQNNSWAGNIPTGGYGSVSTSNVGVNVDYVRAFSLAAIPEPTGVSMLLAGMILAGCKRGPRKTR